MLFNEFNQKNFGDITKSNRQNSEARLGRIPRTTVNDANYTLENRDYLIAYTALTAPRTVIPDTNSGQFKVGKRFIIKDETGNAGTQNITINPTGAQTIDGASTFTINTNYGSVEIYWNGTNWFTLT